MRFQFQSQKGFTLIELIITVLIVAVLARIAIPAYMESVRKAKRTQAQAAIIGLAQALERNFTNTNSYLLQPNGTNTIDATGKPVIYPSAVPPTGTAFYTLTVAIPAGGATFTIRATPVAGGQMATDKCGTFTYTESGAQAVTGTLPLASCWK